MELSKHERRLREVIDAGVLFADQRTKCLRKGVYASIIPYKLETVLWGLRVDKLNGPISEGLECSGEVGNCGCAHAESKVIFCHLEFCIATRVSPDRSILVSSFSPCTRCAHEIVLSRFITHVVFKTATEHDRRGVDILQKSGISVFQLQDA